MNFKYRIIKALLLGALSLTVGFDTLAQEPEIYAGWPDVAALEPITAENAPRIVSLAHYTTLGELNDLQFTPDGEFIIAAAADSIWLYSNHDLTTPPRRIDSPFLPTRIVPYLSAGQVHALMYNASLQQFHAMRFEREMQRFVDLEQTIVADYSEAPFALDPTGRWFALGGDSVQLVDLSSFEITVLPNITEIDGIFTSLSFNQAGTHLLAVSKALAQPELTMFVWDVASQTLINSRQFDAGLGIQVSNVLFDVNPDRAIIQLLQIGGSVGASYLYWDITSTEEPRSELVFDVHYGLYPIPSMPLWLRPAYMRLEIIDPYTHTVIHTIPVLARMPVETISFSPDFRQIAVVGWWSDDFLRSFQNLGYVIDVLTGELRSTFPAHTDFAENVTFSPNGQLLAILRGTGETDIVDSGTGSLALTLNTNSLDAQFSWLGSGHSLTLFTYGSYHVDRWDADDGRLIGRVDAESLRRDPYCDVYLAPMDSNPDDDVFEMLAVHAPLYGDECYREVLRFDLSAESMERIQIPTYLEQIALYGEPLAIEVPHPASRVEIGEDERTLSMISSNQSVPFAVFSSPDPVTAAFISPDHRLIITLHAGDMQLWGVPGL